MIYFLKGLPVAKKRHRSWNSGNMIKTYDPQNKQKQSDREKLSVLALKQGHYLECDEPLVCIISFGLPIPKSFSKKKQKELLNQYVVTKPDLDNYVKYYLDCMNGVIFKDDNQISILSSVKYYVENPYTLIMIEAIDGTEL